MGSYSISAQTRRNIESWYNLQHNSNRQCNQAAHYRDAVIAAVGSNYARRGGIAVGCIPRGKLVMSVTLDLTPP